MHFFGKENFYGGHGIVGAQIGTGAGLAFAEKYRGTRQCVLCFFWRWCCPPGYVARNIQHGNALGVAGDIHLREQQLRNGYFGKTYLQRY